MTRFAIALLLVLLAPSLALAGTVFTEDFENGLSRWTGQGDGPHHGETVADPVQSDLALRFTELNARGDIFTSVNTFAAGSWVLSFDYLGKPITTFNTGGYIGISEGLAGNHRWLEGTSLAGGAEAADLVSDRTWHHYDVPFTAAWSFHIMVEDFNGADQFAENAYFDNIVLSSPARTVPVPGAAGLLLLGLGCVALAVRRRR
jgi:hypothetical protein